MPLPIGNFSLSYSNIEEFTDLNINISEDTLAGDYVVIQVRMDGNITFNIPTAGGVAFDIIQGNSGNNAQSMMVFGKYTTVNNEQIDPYDFTIDDDGAIVTSVWRDVLGVGTTQVTNGNNNNPTAPIATATANNSTFIINGAMDVDAMYLSKKDDTIVIDESDSGDASGVSGYIHLRNISDSHTFTMSASANDTWEVSVIELLSANDYTPAKVENLGEVLTDSSGVPIDIRPSLVANGIVIDRRGETPNELTFDCNTVGSTVTATQGQRFLGERTRRTYQLQLQSGSLSGGLIDQDFYYVEYITDTTFTLRHAGEAEHHLDMPDIVLSSTTGTAKLIECGVHWMGSRNQAVNANRHSDENVYMHGLNFGTALDCSQGQFQQFLQIGTTNTRDYKMLFADTSQNFKYWNVSEGTHHQGEDIAIDVSSNDAYLVSGGHSTASLNSSLIQAMYYCYQSLKTGTAESRISQDPIFIKDPMITGKNSPTATGVSDGITIDDFAATLVQANPKNENLGSGILRLSHGISIGNGVTPTKMAFTFPTVTFQAKSDGIANTFNNYEYQWFKTNSNVLDSISINDAQIKASSPYTFGGSGSPQSISYDGSSVIGAFIDLPSAVFTSVNFINCPSFNINNATLNGCNLKNCSTISNGNQSIANSKINGSMNDTGLLLGIGDISGVNISNCTNGMEIANAGNYTFSGVTFGGNTNDIKVTAISGIVTINIVGGGDTPSYTTAGATVKIVSGIITLVMQGHPLGSTIIVYDLDELDPQNLGTELLRFNSANTSEQYQYAGAKTGDDIQIKVLKPTYRTYSQKVTLSANNSVEDTTMQQETN